MKKTVSVFLTFLLVIQQIWVVAYHFPENEKQEISLSQKIDELKQFGIIDMNFLDSEDELSRNITRGEFAKMIAIIMGGRDYQPSGLKLFEDVETDNEYYPYIEYLAMADAVSSNVHNGMGNWTYRIEQEMFVKPIVYTAEELIESPNRVLNFNPEQEIHIHEAIKLIVIALGYGNDAIIRGGYPGGYISTLRYIMPNISIEFGDGKVSLEKALEYVYEATFCVKLPWKSGFYDSYTETTLKDEFLKSI